MAAWPSLSRSWLNVEALRLLWARLRRYLTPGDGTRQTHGGHQLSQDPVSDLGVDDSEAFRVRGEDVGEVDLRRR